MDLYSYMKRFNKFSNTLYFKIRRKISGYQENCRLERPTSPDLDHDIFSQLLLFIFDITMGMVKHITKMGPCQLPSKQKPQTIPENKE